MITTLWAAVAIVGGTVHPGDAPPIENATVVIEGDRIVAIGAGVSIPAGAEQIDARGKVVTPGLIDGMTQLGLVEIWGVGDVESRTVDFHVMRLRRHLEADPRKPRLLVTVHGAGYRLD